MRGGYYILRGHDPVPVDDVIAWGRWFESAHRSLARDRLPGGVEVSTVFLGLDHAFCGGPPLLFETMIFGGPRDGETNRYSSWEEAMRGHEEMLKLAGGVH